MSITLRKNNHIDICLRKDIRSKQSNGFEHYHLLHNPLPEADFEKFSTECQFLGKNISVPILISSMTGGTEEGEQINRRLVEAAAELKVPFAIGSQRIYITEKRKPIFPYRTIAPNIPILANLGAVQMNYGFMRDDYLRAVEMIHADALIVHLNPLQELIQKNGDTNFSGLLKKIEMLCHDFPVPVIVKEVGWGIQSETAKKLIDAGVSIIDVAGAGGTSWSRVESLIHDDDIIQKIAEPFDDWGIPTAECIAMIHRQYPDIELIASGGIQNGVEAAKAIRLGAKLAGFAARLLPAAAKKTEAVTEELKIIMHQYKIAMFLSSGIQKTEKEQERI